MWEKIKSNSLIKAVLIIIFGVIGFGVAFNIMFGQPTPNGSEEMTGGNTFAYGWVTALQILLILFVIIIGIAIIKYAYETLSRKKEGAGKTGKNVETTKLITVAGILILAILTLAAVFGGYPGIPAQTDSHSVFIVAQDYYLAGVERVLPVILNILLFISAGGLAAGLGMLLYRSLTGGRNLPENDRESE